jgi:hypothetical protein
LLTSYYWSREGAFNINASEFVPKYSLSVGADEFVPQFGEEEVPPDTQVRTVPVLQQPGFRSGQFRTYQSVPDPDPRFVTKNWKKSQMLKNFLNYLSLFR